jgi:RNA polymerase sigma-70 factor, ECF subfamily
VTLAQRLLAPRGSRALAPGALVRSRTSPHAFTEFYEDISPSVLRYFARETREPHHAFDLMAETFAKAFEKRADFRGSSDQQAAAWLWTIARTELARFRRSHTIERAALNRLGLERAAPSDRELREVERLTEIEELQDHLEQALALLPPDQRVVIQLRFIDHLGYPEIAERLGVSTDVVRSRTSRALSTLRASDHVHHAVQALEA